MESNRENYIDGDLIPLMSQESTVIIGKLFDEAVDIFEECEIEMSLNEKKLGNGRDKNI